MQRKLRYGLGGLLALMLGLTLLAGCGSDDNENIIDGRVGRSYVYGTLDGALAVQLMEIFAPRTWRGETDGVLADVLRTPCWDCPPARRPPRKPSSKAGNMRCW